LEAPLTEWKVRDIIEEERNLRNFSDLILLTEEEQSICWSVIGQGNTSWENLNKIKKRDSKLANKLFAKIPIAPPLWCNSDEVNINLSELITGQADHRARESINQPQRANLWL
jgi:hypothetical protein